MKHPEGILGLEGREPFGLVVSMGRKAPGGRGVVEKDRFHLVEPFEDASHVRPHSPRFAPFNKAAPEHRRLVQGMLVHPRRSQAFTHRLSMPSFPKGYPAPHSRPMMLPVCEGDGSKAMRWMQEGDDCRSIKCPNELCEFRQGDPPACKPYAKLAFMIQWSKGDMPTPLCRITTRGKGSTRNLLGFFEYVEGVAQQLGIPEVNWMGLRFTIQLVQKTNPERRRKWWEIVLSPDGDIGEFLRWQHERMREIADGPKLAAMPDLREHDEPAPVIDGIVVGDSDVQ